MKKGADVRVAGTRHVAVILSYVTVGYNVLEGVVSIVVAILKGSSALLGFGIDSFVESLSGLIMIWRLSCTGSELGDEQREHAAIRLIGASLVVLAAYVAYEAISSLTKGEPPERTAVGLIIAVISLIVMPVLYVLKRRAAAALKLRSLATDAKQTLACVTLSVALLLGTGLNFVAGLWQADPVAGLIIAAYLSREGYKAFNEKNLCC